MKPLAPGGGARGFGEREDPPLALGHVNGLRVFEFDNRARGGQLGVLVGHYQGEWSDGENVATCPRDHVVPGPHPECGCGFWAYWDPADALSVWSPRTPVLAVIEGYGPTRSGDKGFRCQLARIVGLHPAIDVAARPVGYGDRPEMPDVVDMRQLGAALIEDVLAERYPSAQVYSTAALMLAKHPVTQPDWVPASANVLRRERWHPPERAPISAAAAMARLEQRQAEPVASDPATMACEACLALCPPGGSRLCEECRSARTIKAGDVGALAMLTACVLCGKRTARLGIALCRLCQISYPGKLPSGLQVVGSKLDASQFRDRAGRPWPGRIINVGF